MCNLNLLTRGPIVSDDEALALDEGQRQRNRELYKQSRRRHARDHPVIQAFGPWNQLLVPPTRPSHHHALGHGWSYAPICNFGIPDYPL